MSAAQWIKTDQKLSVTNTLSAIVSLFSQGELEFLVSTDANVERNFSAASSLVERKTVFIQDLGDARLKLRESLAVLIENWSENITACSFDIGEFAFANDEVAAVDEFKALVVDLYFLLKADQEILGPLPLKQWIFLKSIIEEK
jgi:hypothetical protein